MAQEPAQGSSAAEQQQSPQTQSVPDAPKPQENKQDENSPETAGEKTKEVAQQAADAARKLGMSALGAMRDWENGWLTGPYVGREGSLMPLTSEQRRRIYLEQTLTTPSAYLKRAFIAGVDQWREYPSQWNGHWSGYFERFASREGQFVTANSVAALANWKLGYEPRYDQCKCRTFGSRTRHAIVRNFVTYNEAGERRLQWGLYGGALAGGLMTTAWLPHPHNALVEGAFGVLGQAGYGAALNFFTEFAGDINRKLGAKRR